MVLTSASMQALTQRSSEALMAPVSHAGATPMPPAKVYDRPFWSFLVIEWPAGSAHRTR